MVAKWGYFVSWVGWPIRGVVFVTGSMSPTIVPKSTIANSKFTPANGNRVSYFLLCWTPFIWWWMCEIQKNFHSVHRTMARKNSIFCGLCCPCYDHQCFVHEWYFKKWSCPFDEAKSFCCWKNLAAKWFFETGIARLDFPAIYENLHPLQSGREHKVYKTPEIIFLPIVWQYTGENSLASGNIFDDIFGSIFESMPLGKEINLSSG